MCSSASSPNPPEVLSIAVFSDADFAGDRKDFKSTSGVFVAIVGPQSFFPLGWGSRKQTCASHSSVEAEIVAADEALRLEGIPALDLWTKVLGRTPIIMLYEDSQATSRIIQTGKYPKLRHVQRLHGVNISWLNDLYQKGLYKIHDTHTKRQAGDIFTNHFTSIPCWQHAM